MKGLIRTRCILIMMITIACTNLNAQYFKKLRVGIAFGVGVAEQNYSNLKTEKVFVASLEPSYRINDKISVGIRLETVGQLIGSYTAIASYGINSQYYFSNRNFRPFVGAGVGLYHPSINGDPVYGHSSRLEHTTFGAYPRLGFDWRHFSLCIDVNLVCPAKAFIYPPWPEPMFEGTLNSSYISTKVVMYMGGGRKSVK